MGKIIDFWRSDWSPYIKTFYYTMAKAIVITYLIGVICKEFIIGLNDKFTEVVKEIF